MNTCHPSIRGVIPNEGILKDWIAWAKSHKKARDGISNSRLYTRMTNPLGQAIPDRQGVDLTITITCTAMRASVSALSAIKLEDRGFQVLDVYLEEFQVFGDAKGMLGEQQYSATVPILARRPGLVYYEAMQEIRRLLYEQVEAKMPSALQRGLPSLAMIYEALEGVAVELPTSSRKYLDVIGYQGGVRLNASAMVSKTDTAEDSLAGTRTRKQTHRDIVVSSVGSKNGALDVSGEPVYSFKHEAKFLKNPMRTANGLRNKMVTHYVEEARKLAEAVKAKHQFAVPDEYQILVPIIKFLKLKFRKSSHWRRTYRVPWEPRSHPDDRPEPAKLIKGWKNQPDKRMSGVIVAFWIFSQDASGPNDPPVGVPGSEPETFRWVAYAYNEKKRENQVVGSHGNWGSDAPIPEPFAYKEFKIGTDGRQALPLAREWKKELEEAAGVAHILRVRSELGRIEEERREVIDI